MDDITSLLLDFIRVENAEDRYAFRLGAQEYVIRSAGGGVENVELKWSHALLADFVALHQPGCDPAVIHRVGGTIRDFLKSDEWARQEALLGEAVSRGQPVVVTVRSAAAELYALPWELLTLDASGQHLGELPSVLVRYEWPETRTTVESPSPRPEGGRILFAWSAAGGYVPVAQHLRAIQEGARAGYYPFDLQGDVLERATCGSLDDVLKAAKAPGGKPISVLHLLCHGGTAGQTCGLMLNSETDGEPTVIDAGHLRQLLAPYAGMVRLVVIAACNGGNIGTLGNHLGSVAQALHQIGIAAVIASRFPLSISGSIRFSEIFYRELFSGPSSVETAFLAARRQLARDTGLLDWASMQLYARDADGNDNRPIVLRPYRGLLAFQPEHSRFFFGRDAEITKILNGLGGLLKAGAPRFLVIAGASGTGKSSLVLAGVMPRMLQAPRATWVFAQMRPGAEPLVALESALATRTDWARPLLLVVDQFEEVFTQTESTEKRSTFARRLWALAGDADSRVTVLVTLRVDFIGRCGELPLDGKGLSLDKVAYDEAHRVFVAQMAEAQLEEAIFKPAQLVGITLEAGLTRRMLKDVQDEPGALPLLQDTLDMLWQQRRGWTLTQAAYDAVGGVSGALSLRADARIDELDEAGRTIARRLFLRLVSVYSDTATDIRRRARLTEVRLRPRDSQDEARFDQILGRLVDERLLVRTGDGKATTVEVAHEALIRNWQRLRGWVSEDRERLVARQALESKVEEWRKHGALLNERQLSLLEEALRDSSDELGDDARKLIGESHATIRGKRRRQQFAMAAITFAVVGIAALGVWGIVHAAERDFISHLARDGSYQEKHPSGFHRPGVGGQSGVDGYTAAGRRGICADNQNKSKEGIGGE
ncbi:CHAT domain-containing protein [Cystobacter fuscus]|uniref:CHAT domain-containing protein n=1 Tax=Cystobacter fuscus TaxID=43 RepID=A0A250J8U3_9BACT|nr:CHAT domain-containing protein [Cystobacter fuscus]ATB39937.1 CHAT domain-containing protein [Cystobacter fuscus]